MDENPYKSPKCPQGGEQPPSRSSKRYFFTALYGLLALAGLFTFECGIIGIAVELGYLKPLPSSLEWLVLCAFAVLPLSSGAAVGLWTWRNPESKWASAVAILLGLSPVPVRLIGIFFFS